jgi:hypothetical protein
MLAVFGLGVVYYIAAIPTGVLVLKLHPAIAALCAWAGYTAIAAAMLVIGEPARRWIVRKFNISAEPDPQKLSWRIWQRWGLPGLALLAPVTIGPYIAALIALAVGEKPRRLMFWIAAGVAPWCILFAALAASGVNVLNLWKK